MTIESAQPRPIRSGPIRSDPDTTVEPVRVAVLGLGVMGGSLVRALAGNPAYELAGWSPVADERRKTLEAGVLRSAPSERRDAVEAADIVVLATPLRTVCELMAEIARTAPPEATVTDVASLKVPVRNEAKRVGVYERWVGAHPMAGSEKSGFDASSAELYCGARVWIADKGNTEPSAERIEQVEALWRAAGGVPVRTDATAHDELMAVASHLPQLASNALVATLRLMDVAPRDLGPGGKGMVRLAASAPGMWRDIFDEAPEQLAEGLDLLSRRLGSVAELARERNGAELARLMESTRGWVEEGGR